MTKLSMSIDKTSGENHTLTSSVIRNTTSFEESQNNSQNFTLVCPLKEILGINTKENLRISYGDKDTAKKITPIHREIRESFEEAPDRFIQRHSRFTIVCDELIVGQKKDGGITEVELKNCSLIDGAQTQGVFDALLSEQSQTAYSQYNVRVEVIVEKNRPERVEIAIARNTTNNVSDLSQMGKKEYFDMLDPSCIKVVSKKVQKSETDTEDTIPTQTLLQALRTMVPKAIRGDENDKDMVSLNKQIVRSYSGKSMVLKDYKRYKDNEDEIKKVRGFESPVLKFYREFAGHAWKTYEAWQHDPDWIDLYEKNIKAGADRVCRYDKGANEFTLSWAVLCPTLYGLQHYIHEKSEGWTINLPSNFDKKAYMKKVFELLKEQDFNPQDFAKSKDVYLSLYIYIGELAK